jgi:hypothetical protein
VDHSEVHLQPEPLEAQVAGAMERARRRAGLTVEEMVRRLRPTVRLPDVPAEKKEVRNNWYSWRKRPGSIPAVALVAAAKLAGTSVDALLTESPPELAPDGRLARLEREVADQQRLIEQLQQAVEPGAEAQRPQRRERGATGA